MSKILEVNNKSLEGLNMVNPRQSNAGGMRSGAKNGSIIPFYSPGGAACNLRNFN